MPQKGLRTKNLKFFTGVQNFEENNSVPFDKLYSAYNVRLSGKVISSAPGYQKLGNTLTGGTNSKGLFEYKYFDGSTIEKKAISFYNRQFWEFNKSTQIWDPITTNWPNIEDSKTDGVTFGNALYVIGKTGGKGNGVGKIIKGYDYTFTITATPDDFVFTVLADSYFTFTVSGVTVAPAVGNIYRIGGYDYTLLNVNITGSSGTLIAKRQYVTVAPASSGTMTRHTGSGDVTINYANAILYDGLRNGPVVGDIYACAGNNYQIINISSTSGESKIVFRRLNVLATPPASGILTSVTTTSPFADAQIIFDSAVAFAGITIVPVANDVYQVNGLQFIILSTNITAGTGTITAKKLLNLSDPPPTGTLRSRNSSVTADDTILYTSFTKSASPTTNFLVIPNSPEGVGIQAFVERLFTIGDPSFVGQIVSSQPATAADEYYKVENFAVGAGASYYTAAKESPLKAIRVVNNVLYYSGEATLYQHTPEDIAAGSNPRELSRTGGAVSQDAFAVVENDIWFIAPDNTIRSLGNERELGDNPRTKAVSELIKRTFAILDPVQTNPIITYFNRLVKIRLRTKNSPTNNFTVIFDYNTGGFSFDLGRSVAASCVWEDKVIYGQDSSGAFYYDDLGNTADGVAIITRADTPFIDDNRPDLYKRARYIIFSGKQTWTQPITVKLYRDGDYSTFTTYTIPSPQDRGVPFSTSTIDDGTFGGTQFAESQFGGIDLNSGEEQKLFTLRGYKISLQQKSNMFALGIEASINGGKIVCEQLELMVIDETEEYKRSNI